MARDYKKLVSLSNAESEIYLEQSAVIEAQVPLQAKSKKLTYATSKTSICM